MSAYLREDFAGGNGQPWACLVYQREGDRLLGRAPLDAACASKKQASQLAFREVYLTLSRIPPFLPPAERVERVERVPERVERVRARATVPQKRSFSEIALPSPCPTHAEMRTVFDALGERNEAYQARILRKIAQARLDMDAIKRLVDRAYEVRASQGEAHSAGRHFHDLIAERAAQTTNDVQASV